MNPTRTLVPALSLTMLVSWGSLYYAYALLVQPLQAELGWSPGRAMGAYSLAIVVWGVTSYPVGRAVQRYGGRAVLTAGSALSAAMFATLSVTDSPGVFYAVWAGLGVAMALTLYEPAFAVLVRHSPQGFRRRIGMLTMAGGLASTVFWPLTHLLVAGVGWRGTVLMFALAHLVVCIPLHWLCVPAPERAAPRRAAAASVQAPAALPLRRPAMRQACFWWLALCFVALNFVTSALSMHLVPLLEARGAGAASAVAIAALVGPMQVAGRSIDVLLGNRIRPLLVGTATVTLIPFALVVLMGASQPFPGWYFFIVTYGAGLGLLTLVRAAVPIEFFGDSDYAAMNGAFTGLSVLARAAGPLAVTLMSSGAHPYDGVLPPLLAISASGAAAYLLALRTTRRGQPAAAKLTPRQADGKGR